MNKHLKSASAALAVTLIGGAYWAGTAHADGIPLSDPLSYSGVLTDSDGKLIDGEHDIKILLYDSATGRSNDELLCETEASDTDVDNGHFTVQLHQDCLAAVIDNEEVWVAVDVDGEDLGRSKISAVPYAVVADRAVRAAEGGELQATLGDLQEQIDAVRSTLDDHATQLERYDSGWVELQPTQSIELVHGLGAMPTDIQVLVKPTADGEAVQVTGNFWTLQDESNGRGVIVRDITDTNLQLQGGWGDFCALYDNYPVTTSEDRTCIGGSNASGWVRVLARR